MTCGVYVTSSVGMLSVVWYHTKINAAATMDRTPPSRRPSQNV